MQDPRYKHEYLDSVQSWLTITEGNDDDDESDKHLEARDRRYSWLKLQVSFKPNHKNILFFLYNFRFSKIPLIIIQSEDGTRKPLNYIEAMDRYKNELTLEEKMTILRQFHISLTPINEIKFSL